MLNFDTVTTFFALLSLLAGGSAIVLAGLRIGAALGADGPWRATVAAVGPSAVPLAWLVATTATLGSLYYSDYVGLVPCVLCWFQRIMMYPMVVLLGVAGLRRDPGIRVYVWPLVVLGAAIAIGHYALEWAPAREGALCQAEAPCGVPSFREFGFISLPFMALTGFSLIGTLLLTTRPEDR